MPTVLIAPDKFKGTLTGAEAAEAIAEGVRRVWPDADIRTLPMADGGEGTVDAVLAAGGELRVDRVSGPLGQPVEARWAMLGHTAVIEMAAASGLALVDPTPATALDADSAGTGQLIARALDAGARRFVIGIGGSASTDGGTGALRALGARFLDATGSPVAVGGAGLAAIASLELSGLDPRLAESEIVLCTDVSNPFTGPSGAAAVFGPQKGADAATVAVLDSGLENLARVLASSTGVELIALGWGGAGGGIAGGLHAVLGAKAESGVDVVADLLDLDAHLEGVDLVIVGEGSIDEQSAMGKTPVGVARRATARGIPVIAVAGITPLASDALAADGIRSITTAVGVAPTTTAALADPARWVSSAAALAVANYRSAPAAAPPDPGMPYFHLLRAPGVRIWRGIAAIVIVGVAWVLLSLGLSSVALQYELATGGVTLDDLRSGAIPFTPLILLANNIALAALIPVSMLTQWAIFRRRPRWLTSVSGRFRWRWLLQIAVIIVPLWSVGLLFLLGTLAVSGGFRVDAAAIALIVIVLLTTPLQAAGEEYAFRGIITRSVGSWFRVERVALAVTLVIPNILFAAAHGSGDPWLNFYYFAFGVVLAFVTWRTGGLEAAILLHASNNVILFVPAALSGGLAEGIDRSAGAGGPFILIPLAGLIIGAVLILVRANFAKVATVGPPSSARG